MAYFLVTYTDGVFDILRKKDRKVLLLASSEKIRERGRWSRVHARALIDKKYVEVGTQRSRSLILDNKDWSRKENMIHKDLFPLYVSSCAYLSDKFGHPEKMHSNNA